MRGLSRSGFTAAGVLVLALAGGFVGGAVAMNGAEAPAPAAPVQLQHVAEAATPAPEPTRTPQATLAPKPAALEVPEPVKAPVSAPVSVPVPKVVDPPAVEDKPVAKKPEPTVIEGNVVRTGDSIVIRPNYGTFKENPDGTTTWDPKGNRAPAK